MTSPSAPGSPRKTSSVSRQQPQLCKRELCLLCAGPRPGASSCCSGATARSPLGRLLPSAPIPPALPECQPAGRRAWLLAPHPTPTLSCPHCPVPRGAVSWGAGGGLRLMQSPAGVLLRGCCPALPCACSKQQPPCVSTHREPSQLSPLGAVLLTVTQLGVLLRSSFRGGTLLQCPPL